MRPPLCDRMFNLYLSMSSPPRVCPAFATSLSNELAIEAPLPAEVYLQSLTQSFGTCTTESCGFCAVSCRIALLAPVQAVRVHFSMCGFRAMQFGQRPHGQAAFACDASAIGKSSVSQRLEPNTARINPQVCDGRANPAVTRLSSLWLIDCLPHQHTDT